MDEGKVHITSATLRYDTRNDPEDPRVGWLVLAELEHGRGRYSSLGVTDVTARDPANVPTPSGYTRAFLDLRRYNRISPGAQLNLRLVTGGWMGGDELPLQRRLSVGGPGSLPGFDFRRTEGVPEVGMCTSPNAPLDVPLLPQAQCERLVLAQAEYRNELNLSLFDWFGRQRLVSDKERSFSGVSVRAEWVLFADAGRGWLVGPRDGEGMQYPARSLPGLSTFRADAGGGLDFGILGVYVAKAVSEWSEPVNFFVRVRHRF
jgi:outer membrane protein assembly factor BamA